MSFPLRLFQSLHRVCVPPRRKIRVLQIQRRESSSTVGDEELSVITTHDDEEEGDDLDLFAICERASVDDWFTLHRHLEVGADPNERHHDTGMTLLFAVSGSQAGVKGVKCRHIITKLLEFGADMNTRDDLGRTPLFYAVERGNVHAATVLIAQGADVNVSTSEGTTPFARARELSQWTVVEQLINTQRLDRQVLHVSDTMDDRLPLHDMCAHGTLTSIRALLEYYKVDGLSSMASGGTPLSIASAGNKHDIVQYLTRYRKAPYYPVTQYFSH